MQVSQRHRLEFQHLALQRYVMGLPWILVEYSKFLIVFSWVGTVAVATYSVRTGCRNRTTETAIA